MDYSITYSRGVQLFDYVRAPSHTYPIFDTRARRDLLDRCEHRLTELCLKLDFYALAVSGHSGFMGAMLADRLGLALLAVRKETDTTRADPSTINGHIVPGGKYLFVDDLVSSGSTWANCMKKLPACLTCVGAFLYNPQIHPTDEFLESGPPPIYTLGGMLETA